MIVEPGVYDLTDDEYHADPCEIPSLSSSIGKLLVERTPLHAWQAHPRLNPDCEQYSSPEMDIGTAAHDLILRGIRGAAIIEVENWRTKDARQQRDEARKAGKTPILRKDWNDVEDLASSIRRQLLLHQDAERAFMDGKPEQTLIWKEGDVFCRCRLDWLPDNRVFFDDLKTTDNADPAVWERYLFANGFDFQCAMYRRGIQAVFGIPDPRFRFIVAERAKPHAVSVVEMDQESIALADLKVEKALITWRYCLGKNKWPGYAPVTYMVSAPGWHRTKWEEKEARTEALKQLQVDYLGA